MKTIAAYWNNQIREDSSSGAVFSLLANNFDIVYGVAMSDDCYYAEFIRVNSKDIHLLRGSKYIQAKIGNTYRSVKGDLDEGKQVLFSGTGCHINGLKCFLKKEYHNLYCVDVVCHGVPSPVLWEKYAKNWENTHGKLYSVNFRSKKVGWKDYGMMKNNLFTIKDLDPYMLMFLHNLSLRPSCYHCQAKEHKLSDMTIADFWGIENISEEMDDGKGTSLIIIRTEKGQELFDRISGLLKWKEADYKESIRYNTAEFKSVDCPPQRESFFSDMNKMSFEQLSKKYTPISFSKRAKIYAKCWVRSQKYHQE